MTPEQCDHEHLQCMVLRCIIPRFDRIGELTVDENHFTGWRLDLFLAMKKLRDAGASPDAMDSQTLVEYLDELNLWKSKIDMQKLDEVMESHDGNQFPLKFLCEQLTCPPKTSSTPASNSTTSSTSASAAAGNSKANRGA